MKNIITTLVVTLSLTLSFSQNKTLFGIKAGLNISDVSGASAFVDNEKLSRLHFGLLSELPVSEKFSMQLELLYSQQGDYNYIVYNGISRSSAIENGKPIMQKYEIDYLQLPVLAKYYISRSFSIEIGPTIGVMIYDSYKRALNRTNEIELSGISGLSYKFSKSFFGSVRYTHAITNAFREPKEYYNKSSYSNGKNNVFQFSVGYIF